MRVRSSLLAVAAAGVVVLGTAAPAGAATGPSTYQALAVAQSQQLMSHLTTPFAQLSSPESCTQVSTSGGALLLPVLAGAPGKRQFKCVAHTRAVLLDLGGFICTEDNDPTDVYTTADGRELRFSHGNLAMICQDAIRFVTPVVPVVDGHTLRRHGVATDTAEFMSTVQRSTGSYWDASAALLHPGRLWSAYGGYKQLVSLDFGRHTVVTDLSAITGAPTVLTFDIEVRH